MPSYLVQATTQIKSLARSGNIHLARKLFDEMPQRDTIAWNAMLSSYSQLGLYQEALSLFHHMRISNTRPDQFSFTSVLSASSGALDINYAQKIHSLAIVFGCNSSLPVNNALVNVYGKCLRPYCANKVFEEMGLKNDLSWCSLLFAYTNAVQFDIAHHIFYIMPNRVVVAWNTMIAGYARCGELELCFGLFKEMLLSSYGPDQWTYSAIMNACIESQQFYSGNMVHCLILKSGWCSAIEASNSILSFYAKLGTRDEFIKVNESIKILTQVSFNAIIDAHMKFGDPHKAFLAFEQMCEKNIISWTSMITGYAKNGEEEKALSFFIAMMRARFLPDDFAFGGILQACSNLATLKHGEMVHGLVINFGFHAYAYVGNGLINMYAKCGDIEGANIAFCDIFYKDLISWNALLFAFGLHGQAIQALNLYEEMNSIGIKPDTVTFIALLVTCSHSGLIKQGKALFESMSSIYGITPEIDHTACVVDMLGRGGYLDEARDLARNYANTNASKIAFYEALFGASYCHGELNFGEKLGEDLRLLNPQNEMNYVLLSNLYSTSGQWNKVEMIRKSMVDQNVKKIPGCSWIEIENRVVAFVAGLNSNSQFEQMEILYVLEQEMRNPCFVIHDFEYQRIKRVN